MFYVNKINTLDLNEAHFCVKKIKQLDKDLLKEKIMPYLTTGYSTGKV